ncbi:MAG: hypothetical protein FWG91_05360 [Lachnospiraceae bacterium]|nr:hypothetical protein [Lachnospiraceae bacterium]
MTREINSKTISDLMTASPFNMEGQNAYESLQELFEFAGQSHNEWKMTYLKEVYSEPFFMVPNFINRIRESASDEKETLKYSVNYIRRCKRNLKEFEKSFVGDKKNSALSRTLYIITGSLGSGKTNYVHKLINKAEIDTREGIDDIPYLHCFHSDFEEMPHNNIKFLKNDDYIIDRHPFCALDALELILVENISNCLCEHTYDLSNGWEYKKPSFDKLVKKIESIVVTYKKYYGGDDSDNEKFFEELSNCHLECRTVAEISLRLAEYIKNKIGTDKNGEIYVSERKRSLRYLTDLLFRLFFCLSITESQKRQRKFVLLIDNIERVMYKNVEHEELMFGVDESIIKIILELMNESAKAFQLHLQNIVKSDNFEEKTLNIPAAIMLSMRECTLGIISSDLQDDDKNYMEYVEISEWFDSEEILNKKICYFTKLLDPGDPKNYFSLLELIEKIKIIEQDTPGTYAISDGVYAFQHILKDKTKEPWCLCNFAHNFYNNSIRHIALRFVKGFLGFYEDPDLKDIEYGDNWYNPIGFFNMMCNKNSALIGDKGGINTYLLRRFIIGLLFRYIDEQSKTFGFEDINAMHNDKASCSYTRRILTYLSNISEENKIINIHKSKKNKRKDIDDFEYISAIKLMEDLSIPISESEVFSEILWHLNLFLGKDTLWTGTLHIEVPGGNIFEKHENIRDYICKDFENKKKMTPEKFEKAEKVKVKLNPAGRTFAMCMPDFEYFSARYVKESEIEEDRESYPLLSVRNNNNLNKLLSKIYKSSKSCIEQIKLTEKDLDNIKDRWRYNKKEDGKSHIHRILASQYLYLDNFLIHLERNDICGIDRAEAERMVNTIQKMLQVYNKKFIEEFPGEKTLVQLAEDRRKRRTLSI